MNFDWMKDASCKGKTALFFFSFDEPIGKRRKREYEAKAICRECKSLAQCREYARSNNELGIWGGESEEDRYKAGYLSNVAVNRFYSRRKSLQSVRNANKQVALKVKEESAN